MMGNFSIGDYFKEQAIPWAWELTSPEWYGLDAEKCVCVYPKDQEARKIWEEKTSLPDGHIYEVEDNFGTLGRDLLALILKYSLIVAVHFKIYLIIIRIPGGENERYLEIWNLVSLNLIIYQD